MFTKKYKDTLQRYEDFWERKNTNRGVINMWYPDPNRPRFPAPASLEQQWLDEEYQVAKYKYIEQYNTFVGEGIPMLFTNLGPGCLAACIGGNYGLASNTVWFDREAIITDWEALPNIEFDENSEMWQHVLRMQKRYAEDPDVHFSITDLGGVMDIIASLRTTNDLLYDLYDYPEEIKALKSRVLEMWSRAYDQQVETIRKTGQPYNNWMNIPSAKPWYPLQCDFCYMISPDHFDEFVLPDLIAQAKQVERPVYHLDGVGELAHLDKILDIPGLAGIQWAPGAGEAPEWDEKWFPVYKKIQDKKKNLILLRGISGKDNDVEGIEKLTKNLDPTGVYLKGAVPDRKSAEKLMNIFENWTR